MRSIKDMGKSSEQRINNEDISSLKQKYEGKSENELLQELFKKVSTAKAEGTFSNAQLDEFVGFMSPNLDDAARARLNELVGMLKGNG